MSDYVLANVGYGRITLEGGKGSLTLTALRVTGADFSTSSAIDGIPKRGNGSFMIATEKPPAIGGGFGTRTLEVPPMTILILQARSLRPSSGWGRGGSDGSLFLMPDSKAPTLAVSVSLPVGGTSMMGERFLCFQGSAYLLDEDHMADLGCRVPQRYAKQYRDKSDIDTLFDVHVVRGGVSPNPSFVVTRDDTGKRQVVSETSLPGIQPALRVRRIR